MWLRPHDITDSFFSPGGLFIVAFYCVVHASRGIIVYLWDFNTYNLLGQLAGHTGAIQNADFSADSMRIVTASADRTARIWDRRGLREVARLNHEGIVWDARFSADNRRIVTASGDGTARLWDAESAREIARLQHPGSVRAAVFSPDGRRIATTDESSVRVWEER